MYACVYIYIYIYIYIFSKKCTFSPSCDGATANLRTMTLDVRGFDSSITSIIFKGWNSQPHREFPGQFESTSLSRDNFSREIGRTKFQILSLGGP